MKKILIFKSDRIGDLINISSVINNLKKNFPHCEISIVCSKYNSNIAKYYSEFSKILLSSRSLILFLIKNFKNIFLTKYDLILQLDGKKNSYFTAMLANSKLKAGIKFIKKKRLFGFDYKLQRPNFLISSSYNILESCNEDYNVVDNKSYHYLDLYLKILKKLDLKIYTRKHYLPFKSSKNVNYDSYLHLHIDEKWLNFNSSFFDYFEEKITTLSKKNNICVTSNLTGNLYFYRFKNKFIKNHKFLFKDSVSVDDLLNIIYFSHTIISSHAGFVVHAGAAFKKKIIDIVPSNINNELDRWIPFDIDYKRINISNSFELSI